MTDNQLRRLIRHAVFRWPDLMHGVYARRLDAAHSAAPYLPGDLTPERRAKALVAWAECLDVSGMTSAVCEKAGRLEPGHRAVVLDQIASTALYEVWGAADRRGDDPLEAIVEWIDRRAEDWRRIVGACSPEMAADPGTSPGRQTTGRATAQEESTE